jgi:phosphatidylglycerol lysyltransferase
VHPGSVEDPAARRRIFSSAGPPVLELEAQRALAAGILAREGRSPLDSFKLWPDKSYFFSEDRRSFIAYRTAWGVALGLGDPAGPAEALPQMIGAFTGFCIDRGWKVAFHQVLPDLLPIYRGFGLHVMKIGEEAIVDLDHFAAQTCKRRAFRRVQRKLDGAGYLVVQRMPPHSETLIDELEQVSREWLSLPGRRERTFALGRFERSYIRETPVFAVREPAGRLIAFVNRIRCYRAGDATVDLMRHRVEVPNGVMEYLFRGVMLAVHQEGCRRFSLGLAPFSRVGDRAAAATLKERAIHHLSEHLHGVFSFRGLAAFKAKFEPQWEERFLIHEGGALGLTRAALALRRVTED